MRQLRIPAVLILALALQNGVLGRMTLAGVRPDTMLLVPIVVGLIAGSELGAVWGFVAGAAVDLFLQTPMGLSALTFSLIGFAVGSLQSSLIRSAWWITPAVAAAASVTAVGLFAVLGATVGVTQLLRPSLLTIMVVVALANAVLAIPAFRAWRWALPQPLDRALVR